jgi:tetratricopeptide (TPR) repeat protein
VLGGTSLCRALAGVGSPVDALLDAVIAWLTNQAMAAGKGKLIRLLRGDRQQSVLRKIVQVATDRAVAEVVSRDDRCVVKQALLLEGPGAAGLEISDVLGLHEAVLRFILPSLMAVAERGYWADADQLAVVLAHRIEEGIQADAMRDGPLRPLAELLRYERLAEASEGTVEELRQVNRQLKGALGGVAQGNLRLSRPSDSATRSLRMLPSDVVSFSGRTTELRELMTAVASCRIAGSALGISAIDGMPGVGKTAFAVHAAHKLASQFPDGQCFLRLYGHSPDQPPVDPSDALATLLWSVGLSADQIPFGADARAGLWRDRMAGKRALVLLDDAIGSDQVSPLLPGAPETLVLVTSRRRLTALEGARSISLDVLSAGEAAEMLIRLADRPDLAIEDADLRKIADLCGFLPLAIGMLARRLHHHPAWSAAEVAAELTTARHRLELMRAENLSVAAAFDLSYRDLTSEQQRLFRRLSVHAADEIGTHAAASLDGAALAETGHRLDVLYDHHLIAEPGRGRYRVHQLIREHARLLATADPASDRLATLERLLSYYLHTAHAAAMLINGARGSLDLPPTPLGTIPEDLEDHDQALAWFTVEYQALLALTGRAAEAGFDGPAWQLPWTLADYLQWQGHNEDLVAIQHIALAATERLSDTAAQARAHLSLGRACFSLRSWNDARNHLSQALEVYVGLADRVGQARCHISLGKVAERLGHHREALTHARQALALFDDAGNRPGQARALNNVGWYHALLGDHNQALMRSKQALVLQRELGDRCGEANTWDSLGYSHHHLGQHAKATSCYQRAVSLFEKIGDPTSQAETLIHLGDQHRAVGNRSSAIAVWGQALQILDELHSPDTDLVRQKLSRAGEYPAKRQPSTN